MTTRPLAAALGLALCLVAARPAAAQPSPGHYQAFGDARGFLNIVPPGQDGVLNGPEATAAQGAPTPAPEASQGPKNAESPPPKQETPPPSATTTPL